MPSKLEDNGKKSAGSKHPDSKHSGSKHSGSKHSGCSADELHKASQTKKFAIDSYRELIKCNGDFELPFEDVGRAENHETWSTHINVDERDLSFRDDGYSKQQAEL